MRLPYPRVSLVCAHAPSFVRLGSKPLRVLRDVDQPIAYLKSHLRDAEAARAYAPHQVFIGNLGVDDLVTWPTPWHRHPVAGAQRFGPDGEIMPEDEFLGLLATCDGLTCCRSTATSPSRADRLGRASRGRPESDARGARGHGRCHDTDRTSGTARRRHRADVALRRNAPGHARRHAAGRCCGNWRASRRRLALRHLLRGPGARAR